MFEIKKNFGEANIEVVSIEGDSVKLAVEIRDTTEDWFYWAFCVTGAAGKTLTFTFENKVRVGHYGAAVSHDLSEWHWQYGDGYRSGDSFTYTFGESENIVYFAHDMLYRPERFFRFAKDKGIKTETLCKSRKGRDIPCFTLGNGSRHLVFTARHHACESTGSYVLEGVISEYLENPIPDTTLFCVPIVDFDGVTDGDQGKSRFPHDHNRDYGIDAEPVYPEVAKIRNYIGSHNVILGADFHSPWHTGVENDHSFFVYRDFGKEASILKFASLFEESLLPNSMKFKAAESLGPLSRPWITPDCPDFMCYVLKNSPGIGFTLETTYFGLNDDIYSTEKARLLGRSFEIASKKYLAK